MYEYTRLSGLHQERHLQFYKYNFKVKKQQHKEQYEAKQKRSIKRVVKRWKGTGRSTFNPNHAMSQTLYIVSFYQFCNITSQLDGAMTIIVNLGLTCIRQIALAILGPLRATALKKVFSIDLQHSCNSSIKMWLWWNSACHDLPSVGFAHQHFPDMFSVFNAAYCLWW